MAPRITERFTFPDGQTCKAVGRSIFNANAVEFMHRPDESAFYISPVVASTGNADFTWFSVPRDAAYLQQLAHALLSHAAALQSPANAVSHEILCHAYRVTPEGDEEYCDAEAGETPDGWCVSVRANLSEKNEHGAQFDLIAGTDKQFSDKESAETWAHMVAPFYLHSDVVIY